MRILTLLVILFMVSACDDSWTQAPKTRYTLEYFELPDGIPCYVVKGGTHSGMVGITCNYGEKK
jgi:hypothetical protein